MISITLPSIHPAACERTLENIKATTRTFYQVIVVSPFKPPEIVGNGQLAWIHDEKQRGCNWAHWIALERASEQYITPFVDDHLYIDGWDLQALVEYYKLNIEILGLRHTLPGGHVGSVFGYYYPYFPFMWTMEARQVWFDPAFKSGFADSDLALRAYERGWRADWMREPVITTHEDDSCGDARPSNPADMKLFIDRWHKKFGSGYFVERLRQFNIDYEIDNLPPGGLKKCA